jgi:hypothetical protein
MFPVAEQTRALSGPAARRKGAARRLRCFAHNLERELAAGRIFLFGFAVTHSKAPIRTNKSKQIQGFLLGFAWFYLDRARR